MRYLAIFILSSITIFTAFSLQRGECADEYPYTGEITGNNANVRAGSNLNYEIVTQLNRGDMVIVLGERMEWLKIRPPEDVIFWVSARHIVDGYVGANTLNVRSGPDLKFNVVCQIVRDDKVDTVKTSDDGQWLGIKPPENSFLWINKELVEKKGKPEVHDRHIARQAELRGIVSALESDRDNAMKKDPLLVPYDALIARYEKILADYPEFRDETRLAERRINELNKMKDALETRVAEQGVVEEETGTTEPAGERRYVTAKGTLLPGEGKAGELGLFKVTDGPRVICMVRSGVVDLKQYSRNEVQVWGMEEADRSYGVPLIDITRIKRLR